MHADIFEWWLEKKSRWGDGFEFLERQTTNALTDLRFEVACRRNDRTGLEDYFAALIGLVYDDGLDPALFPIAGPFGFVPRFVLEMLLHWYRFKEEDASKFHRTQYGHVPLLRHREGAGKISGGEMRQDHAEELRLRRVSE